MNRAAHDRIDLDFYFGGASSNDQLRFAVTPGPRQIYRELPCSQAVGRVSDGSASGLAELKLYMASRQRSTVKVFSLEHFTRESNGTFTAIVKVAAMLGHVTRQVTVTDQTNAGMRNFKLETVQ